VQVRNFRGNLKLEVALHIARPFGIPVRVHWSFFGLVAGLLAYGWYLGGGAGALGAAVGSVFLCVSVVLHELGHALAARRYDIPTADITLYPFGGIARIERIPEDPNEETVIALAGPAVNFVLAALGGWIWLGTDGNLLAQTFIAMNVFMGLFNLIPAFPMDGGRVLRATLARHMGWMRASRLAVRIGRGFAWLFLVGGWWWSNPSLMLVGVFLHVALNAEKARLVALHWYRETGTHPPWDPQFVPSLR
jgi:stage IV sporulation protein FB